MSASAAEDCIAMVTCWLCFYCSLIVIFSAHLEPRVSKFIAYFYHQLYAHSGNCEVVCVSPLFHNPYLPPFQFLVVHRSWSFILTYYSTVCYNYPVNITYYRHRHDRECEHKVGEEGEKLSVGMNSDMKERREME